MREKLDRYFLRGCFADTTVQADPGAGGADFAVDDAGAGGVFPYAKLAFGASGTQTPVSSGDPLPVEGEVTVSGTVDVTGTVAVTGVSTAAKQDTGNTSLASIDGKITACNTGAVVISSGTITTVSAVTAISNALPAGNNNIGDVDVASIAAGTNTIGGVTPRPETANGLSISRDLDLDNGTLTVVKGSAGQLYGWDITNRGTVTAYVKFYNATSGTLGTGTPEMTIGIPGNASDNTLSSKSLAYGIAFGTGICVGAGTGFADNDTGDPGANIVIANIYYK